MTLGVGLTHSINNFGHDNEWYSYCTMGGCVGFVEREDEDGITEN